MLKNIFNFTALLKAGGYAIQGLIYGLQHERPIQQEIILIIVLCCSSFYIAINPIQLILLNLPLFLLLIVEFLNSAIEKTVDRISMEQHNLSGLAKNFAAAAVFISVLAIIFIWSVIMYANYTH